MAPSSIAAAQRHVASILTDIFRHGATDPALIVYDTRCSLSEVLAKAYCQCLPQAPAIDFDAVAPAEILAAMEGLAPGALVVLVQSGNFRLEAYRLRVELFKRGLKVIEHPHLSRMAGIEAGYYIDALAYDTNYFLHTGHGLKQRIDQASNCTLVSGDARLEFSSGFEIARLNIGDYTGMQNVGGQFPIGEVFTEARDLEAVQGRVRIGVFGDTDFRINQPPRPITLVIERGRVADVLDSTEAFDQVLAMIRAAEGEVRVRELGFGLNRAFSPTRLVSDIGTYERMCGVHLSLGAKHGTYSKPEIRRAAARYHIDVFAQTETVWLDDEQVFGDGAWLI